MTTAGVRTARSPRPRPPLALRPAIVAIAACLAAAGPAAADPPKRPLVLAHYMPWFVAKPASPAWGWHWTMNAFDPDKVDGGRRPIASHYYPLIGPYDSGDPVVIEYHLLLMKLAGIDGLVADWYGLAGRFDYPVIHRHTAALFPAAARFGLKVAICYEDRTIPELVEAGVIARGDRVEHAEQTLGWLREHWFAEASYLKLGGRPVLLSFGSEGLTDREWQEALPRGADAPLYLSEHRRRPAASGGFDWPVPKEGPAAAERFYEASRDWPARMPAVYPRFHDIYAEAKVHPSYGRIPDDRGRTFATSLKRALTSGAPLVQVVTWNDWGEGTAVEPSAEFGYRDLEATQRLRRELIDPGFAPGKDDLRLVHRLYLLRRRRGDRAGLDEIARLLAAGQFPVARERLDRAEAAAR
jgi:hypothetical protein